MVIFNSYVKLPEGKKHEWNTNREVEKMCLLLNAPEIEKQDLHSFPPNKNRPCKGPKNEPHI